MEVYCPYCESIAVKKQSVYGFFYLCQPCDAKVGCHKGTDTPLGILAKPKLRKLRQKAHECFDRLWKAKMNKEKCSKKEARKAAYKWLANELGVSFEGCHIANFDESLCLKVIEVCTRK